MFKQNKINPNEKKEFIHINDLPRIKLNFEFIKIKIVKPCNCCIEIA